MHCNHWHFTASAFFYIIHLLRYCYGLRDDTIGISSKVKEKML